MTRANGTMVLSPIGLLPEELLSEVATAVTRAFGCHTAVVYLLENADFAFDALRHQYHSTAILERLAASSPVHADKILGLTTVDLFIPILTHVFGEAQLGGRACVVSTCRLLLPASPLPGGSRYQRISKEAIHELGHTFDLRHCRDPACVMHFCRSENDVDRKSSRFCRYCQVLLDDVLTLHRSNPG
ncbi:MAG: peptidase M54 [Pseudomonadota bacterium]